MKLFIPITIIVKSLIVTRDLFSLTESEKLIGMYPNYIVLVDNILCIKQECMTAYSLKSMED